MPEEMPATCPEGRGRNPREDGTGASKATATEEHSWPGPCSLMEAVLERGNMRAAYERVVSNQGSAGVDGMTVDQLDGHVRSHWPSIKAALLDGTYQPSPIRPVTIPKPGGGERTLGIPTVVDRLIQQRSSVPSSKGSSLTTATGSVRGGVRMTQCAKHSDMCPKAGGTSWTWTWRSSSTG